MARQKKESSASNPYLLHHSILLLNNPTILGSKSKDSERITMDLSDLVTLHSTCTWKCEHISALGRSYFGQYLELDLKYVVNKHQLIFLVTLTAVIANLLC